MRRKSFDQATCPVARSLDAVGDWWSLLIVRDALSGIRRFGDFQKSLGLAKNILAQRLRRLVELGIMETLPAQDGGAYREYALTPKGEGLLTVIIALRQWGTQSCFSPDEARESLIETKTGLPVARLEVRSQDGRPLTAADLRLKHPIAGEASSNPVDE
ncbi:winged helix-turn-helix transcriptional regulator [Cupriavidus lacunae]|uniref:Transcriptional regulator n=1 Tax=Cupriavidus lacunae TaxID=2666307 RepID=A0A370NRZ9_9BURK|nr:helix-turn-helix domain-containing protein [Cupriavidus lacunae]RDK08387.1 transcriptional regulator [Cupriavidus lacunae]